MFPKGNNDCHRCLLPFFLCLVPHAMLLCGQRSLDFCSHEISETDMVYASWETIRYIAIHM